jgi:NAD(P)-dependent dehydrogenase (short-subunit alcohol dehydrogenase family)
MKVLITGANRGIGLALTEVYLKNDVHVIATARDLAKATDLLSLQEKYSADSLTLETVDIADEKSVQDLWGRLANLDGIDVLINNAGILKEYSNGLSDLSFDVMIETFNVNSLGPMRMIKHGVSKLLSGAKVINISSKVGSIDDNSGGQAYAYRVSKTALNMINKNISLEFPEFIVVSMHPGWVQTDMGGGAAPTSAIESAAGIYAVIDNLSLKDSGAFVDFRGQQLPW